ncbi:MAG: RagB/SusD family nutrient uptake outer membrane protein [Gemmatimonadaceae bacterium]
MTTSAAFALGIRRGAGVAAVLAALALGACSIDEALTVPDPDVAKPGTLDDKSALPVLRTGAIGDFARGFSGGGDSEAGLIQDGGLLADELEWAETFPTRREYDSRNMQITNGSLGVTFRLIQRARASAERGARAFEKFDATNPQRAEMRNLEGMSAILMAESYCSGVPFSELTPEGETVFGDPLTTVQMLNAAVAAFDKALAQVGTGTSAAAIAQANFARVGKGRALLNVGQFANAAAAVTAVPTSFQYITEHSENSSRQNNGVFVVMAINRRFSVADREGINGLPYRSDNDPRTLSPRGSGAASVGFDGTTPLFLPTKYPNRSASMVVASGIEARLIEAEAALQAGNATQAYSILNALRSTIGLAALTDPGTAAGRVDALFKERAYWFFLTAHRLGDMRRLVRQYARGRESVFPTGAYPASKGGGAYGPDVNFPIPFDEQNNPKFTQCLDRNA